MKRTLNLEIYATPQIDHKILGLQLVFIFFVKKKKKYVILIKVNISVDFFPRFFSFNKKNELKYVMYPSSLSMGKKVKIEEGKWEGKYTNKRYKQIHRKTPHSD